VYRSTEQMKISRGKFIKYSLQFLSGLFLLDALWIEKFFIEVNEFYLKDATAKTDNFKFIQVSDLHLHAVGYSLKKIAKQINDSKADLVFFTGDSIDKAENLKLLREFLQLIDTSIQKTAILGNWEYWGNVDVRKLRLLYSDLLAMKTYQESDFHVVLTHCPEHRDVIATQTHDKIDLILSGHTHGGQINIFGYAPFKPPGSGKYTRGWYTESQPPLYVSKGIGTSILPVRFGARSEISIFNLKDVEQP
jgi:predicted MPP superfamily phosphohydrolase